MEFKVIEEPLYDNNIVEMWLKRHPTTEGNVVYIHARNKNGKDNIIAGIDEHGITFYSFDSGLGIAQEGPHKKIKVIS